MTTTTRLIAVSFLPVLLTPRASSAQIAVGGTPTGGQQQEVSLPQNQTPGLTFVNKTGVPICDFVITFIGGAANINGAILDDGNQGGEDWDVDDNANGMLDPAAGGAAGESATLPVAEGAGGAALANPDNALPAGGRTIRIQENGLNDCVGNNRNFEITIAFSARPDAGDKIRIQPTNERGANLFAFVGGLDKPQDWVLAQGAVIKPAFAGFGTAPGMLINSIQVAPDVELVSLRSEPAGQVFLSDGLITFDPPVSGDSGLLLEGELATFGRARVTSEAAPAATPPPAAPKKTCGSCATNDGPVDGVVLLLLLIAAVLPRR